MTTRWLPFDGAHALVMATEWPEYRAIGADQLLRCTERLLVWMRIAFCRTSQPQETA